MGLRVEELDGDEVALALGYVRKRRSLSLPDGFALALAAIVVVWLMWAGRYDLAIGVLGGVWRSGRLEFRLLVRLKATKLLHDWARHVEDGDLSCCGRRWPASGPGGGRRGSVPLGRPRGPLERLLVRTYDPKVPVLLPNLAPKAIEDLDGPAHQRLGFVTTIVVL